MQVGSGLGVCLKRGVDGTDLQVNSDLLSRPSFVTTHAGVP